MLDFERLVVELKKALAEWMLNTEFDVHLGDETEHAVGNHEPVRNFVFALRC